MPLGLACAWTDMTSRLPEPFVCRFLSYATVTASFQLSSLLEKYLEQSIFLRNLSSIKLIDIALSNLDLLHFLCCSLIKAPTVYFR